MGGHRKQHYSHIYVPHVFSNPTTWSFRPLLAEARDHVVLGDFVRVCLEMRVSDMWHKRYVKITEIHGDHILGIVDDPYSGSEGAGCDGCNKYFGTTEKGILTCSLCSFHLCVKCQKTTKHEHKLVPYSNQPPFCNGTIISFKRNAIMEIPNWTTNGARIGERFLADIPGQLFGNLPYSALKSINNS